MPKDDCSKFIEWLLANCPQSRIGAAIFGGKLIVREVLHYRGVKNTKSVPTAGFKSALTAYGQLGDLYRHLRFHIGCRLIPIFGPILSYLAEELDHRQADEGRAESRTELLNNHVAKRCGDSLCSWIKGRKNLESTRQDLFNILHISPPHS